MNTRADDARADVAGLAGKRPILIVVLPLARLALGAAAVCGVAAAGFGGYWLAVGSAGIERLFAPAPTTDKAAATIDLPELIVNLRADTPSRFLKIALTLAVAPADRGKVEQAMPYLNNALQDFLRNIDQHDLQGSAGLFRLRTELRRRFNLIIGQDAVADVLLRGLLTQ
ncbi:MAG TPA: flagellar basal body-associated FliL family protein [Azospirillum sp.]|nr:flagellar basal body-associated FliL family protein [Azospirillum sp.]